MGIYTYNSSTGLTRINPCNNSRTWPRLYLVGRNGDKYYWPNTTGRIATDMIPADASILPTDNVPGLYTVSGTFGGCVDGCGYGVAFLSGTTVRVQPGTTTNPYGLIPTDSRSYALPLYNTAAMSWYSHDQSRYGSDGTCQYRFTGLKFSPDTTYTPVTKITSSTSSRVSVSALAIVYVGTSGLPGGAYPGVYVYKWSSSASKIAQHALSLQFGVGDVSSALPYGRVAVYGGSFNVDSGGYVSRPVLRLEIGNEYDLKRQVDIISCNYILCANSKS